MTYDLVIIGGGPAGASAAVYAARKQLKTAIITPEWGGQSVVSPDIQNWIGTPHISGSDLAKALETHVEEYQGEFLDIHKEKVTHVEKTNGTFTVKTEKESYETKTVLVATGSDRRKLPVPGADKFEHKGLTYCATCDGPLFGGQDVAVIGGGNAGFESAAQLAAYAKSVTILHRNPEYKADKITVEKVLAKENVTGITNASTTEVFGDGFVTGLKYKDKGSGEEKTLDVTGIFVEIGAIPTTGFVANLVELDEIKRIKIDPWTQATSVEGVWAAGDATNILYHQNNIAAGDAVKALEDIYLYLHTK